MVEKKGKLLQKINTLSHGQLEELLISYRFCPLCFEDDVESILQKRADANGLAELVCVNCGYVPNQQFFGVKIPFGYAGKPGNGLDLDNGMGNTLGEKGTFCVLAHSPAFADDKTHMPLSATFIRIITHKHEHPKIATLKTYCRQLCHEYGFDALRHEWAYSGLDEHGRAQSLVFSNYLARIVKRVGRDLANINERANLRKIADACFAYAVKKLKGENEFVKVAEKLNVNLELLGEIKYVCEIQKKREGNKLDADEFGSR